MKMWWETKDNAATIDVLVQALKSLNHNRLANLIKNEERSSVKEQDLGE